MSKTSSTGEHRLREPLVGFVAAIVLTLIPFGAVAGRPLSDFWIFVIIGACGVVQILVHLRYFLHLSFRNASQDRLLAIGFAGVILFLMAGGTIWIMLNLHSRMVF